jgi:hypothetical protein
MLCSACASITPTGSSYSEIRLDGPSQPHHQTFANLKLAVQQGCYICSLLYSDLQTDLHGRGSQDEILDSEVLPAAKGGANGAFLDYKLMEREKILGSCILWQILS